MTIHNHPGNLIVVDLPFRESQIADELKAVNEAAGANPACDVIINFAKVEIVTSSNLSNLLILRSILAERSHRLLLCNVSVITKCVFRVAGLDEIFEFAKDVPATVAAIQTIPD